MKRFLIWVAAAVMLVSCTQETTITIAPDVSTWTFGPEGGEFNVVIFTNGHWTASCTDPAVSFAPASGDFTTPMHVVVGENTEHFTKSMRISLLTDLDGTSRSSKVVITQECAPFIVCEDNPVKSIGPEGGAVRFTVNSNEPWTAFVPDGTPVSVDPVSGGPNSTVVTLSVSANPDPQPCTYQVRLYLTDTPSEKVDLTVIQAARID